jgi:hypothetical protein
MVNSYAERTRRREDVRFARAKEVPQGENLLVHAWTWAIQQYPPEGLTIWLHRTEPLTGSYEFFIPGHAVVGEFPDRRLYEEAQRRRRQPNIAEHFFGRVKALSHDGTHMQIACGHIELPPEPAAAPWDGNVYRGVSSGQPSGPPVPPPYGSYGSPWGGGSPPSWTGAPPHGGSSPWWSGAMPPWIAGPPPAWWMQAMQAMQAQHAQPQPPPPPPAAVQNNPDLLSMWNAMLAQMQPFQQMQGKMLTELMTRVFAAQPAAAAAAATQAKPPELLDQVHALGALAEALDKIRGPAPAAGGERRGLHIHKIDDHTLVENKEGDLDPVATAIFELKDTVKSVAARRAGGLLGGNKSPNASSNGAPKSSNGTPKS